MNFIKYLIVLTLLLGSTPHYVFAQATSFKDIKGHWAEDDIIEMEKINITVGKEVGLFDPEGSVTRAEFTAFLLRAMKKEVTVHSTSSFKDVKKGDWYFDVVETGLKEDLIGGYPDGTFQPNASITREEMAAILYRAIGRAFSYDFDEYYVKKFKDYEQIQNWARVSVAVTAKFNLLNGMLDGTFRPSKNATRAESIVVIKRLYDKLNSPAPVLSEVQFEPFISTLNQESFKFNGKGTANTKVYLRSLRRNEYPEYVSSVHHTVIKEDGTFEFTRNFSYLDDGEWILTFEVEDALFNRSEQKELKVIKDTVVSYTDALDTITSYNENNYSIYTNTEKGTYSKYTFIKGNTEIVKEILPTQLAEAGSPIINLGSVSELDDGLIIVKIYKRDPAGNESFSERTIIKNTK